MTVVTAGIEWPTYTWLMMALTVFKCINDVAVFYDFPCCLNLVFEACYFGAEKVKLFSEYIIIIFTKSDYTLF